MALRVKVCAAKFDDLSAIITHTAEGEGQELENWLTVKGTCSSSEGPEFSSDGPGSSQPSVTPTPGELEVILVMVFSHSNKEN